MAAWVLVAWAHQIRAELAEIAPRRDKASDGSVGDLAHSLSVSGHNPDDTPGVRAERSDADTIPEVRAIDIDKDLRVPGLTMQMIVAYLVGRCRAGREKRLIYIIFNGVIWSASSGWVARRYTGSNKHEEHAHLSGHPDYDNDRRPFGLASLVEDDMPLTDADQPVIKAAVHSTQIGRTGITFGQVMDQMRLLPGQVKALQTAVTALAASRPDVDTDTIVARMDALAAEDRQRDEQAAAERAELADLVRQQQTGELTAEQVVNELARRLAS